MREDKKAYCAQTQIVGLQRVLRDNIFKTSQQMNIKEFGIIFIGGIHGVGKTDFSAKASKALDIPCLSASKLIADQRNAPAAINKRVQSVEKNQNALITAIESQNIRGKNFLLDGHFCVFDSTDFVKKVPFGTFRTLAPVAIIVLHDDVDRIRERLQKRDKRTFSTELLNRLQETELEYANEVCNLLKIPMCQARTSEQDKAVRFAASHLK
jgi:adenylate kinase